jgi:hypothetical protein
MYCKDCINWQCEVDALEKFTKANLVERVMLSNSEEYISKLIINMNREEERTHCNKQLGLCLLHRKGIKICCDDPHDPDTIVEIDALYFHVDDIDTNVKMRTGENFGCIHFEAK